MQQLMLDIERYLAFMDEAHEEVFLWKEYSIWKALTDSPFTLKEKMRLYTLL